MKTCDELDLGQPARPVSSISTPGNAESSSPTLETALKTRLGRKLPRTMRMIATRYAAGETPVQIARDMGIESELVNNYLRYVVSTLDCQPLPLNQVAAKKGAKAQKPLTDTNQLPREELFVEAKCEACGAFIRRAEGRIVIAAMELDYDSHEYGYGVQLYLGRLHHYCPTCGVQPTQFCIPNPWFVTDEQRRAEEKWREALMVEAAAEPAQSDERLRQALAGGDMRAFNAVMPTRPDRGDVMARAVPVSRVAAKIAAGMDEPVATSEIADQLFSNDEGWKKVAAVHSAGSGEIAQRAKLVGYLNSLQSRGKMLPDEREAARMWTDGLSENEIARRQGVNQSTVHRRIDSAKKKANAKR
jgi:DNA-binding CsgD family transcriptional regulator